MTVKEKLRDKAGSLPMSPGVYIMKDADGKIIYVGKSKKLKNRVTSYFAKEHPFGKTARMVSLVRDFDYILCKTEIEALTLENVLIKRHSPKYNIKLKDAKSYPYIKLCAGEYPRLTVTRERRSDGGKYFGPYQGTSIAYGALETVLKTFLLPTCKRRFPEDIGKERPCIYRDMGRCIAPCTGKVGKETYLELVRGAARVLAGNVDSTVAELTRRMTEAAEREEFEKAAGYRDRIRELSELGKKQKVVSDRRINRDVFSIYTSEVDGIMATLNVRGGALINKNEFILSSHETVSSSEAISLVSDYYRSMEDIPKEILIDFDAEEEDVELLSEYLTLLSGSRVTVRRPERGDGRALIEMARENAKEAARQYRLTSEREDRTVTRLATLLGLSGIPRRIEAYDISNIGDECIRASMVVYRDGKLKRSDYRSFKITSTDGRDDYGSMREALRRRLSHLGDGSPSLGEAPDLILLDGGDTHVGAIKPIIEELGLEVPLFGMVKDEYHKTRAITDGKREIAIATEMNVYAFIYNLQEEAHRFAVKHSSGEKLRSMKRSALEKVPGIGAKKAKALLSAFPLWKIKQATAEELMTVKGIGRRDAESIARYYREEKGKKG